MSENQKLADEIERRRSNPTALGNIAYEHLDTILAALRASDQLPKTADGVPIVPGMQVWTAPFDEIEEDGSTYHHDARAKRT